MVAEVHHKLEDRERPSTLDKLSHFSTADSSGIANGFLLRLVLLVDELIEVKSKSFDIRLPVMNQVLVARQVNTRGFTIFK